MNSMVNIYITEKFLKDTRYLPVLYPHLGELRNEKRLFSDLGYRAFKRPAFNLVKNINDADFVLLPHEYFDVIKIDKTYLTEHLALARQHNKKLLIFDFSDFTNIEINIPEAIIFRLAEYKHRIKKNVFIMPAFTEDLSLPVGVKLKEKSDIPIVGFCGFADLGSAWQKARFWTKIFLLDIIKIITFNRRAEVLKRGLFFRKKAISNLGKCSKIKSNFIIRKSYSSHQATIELLPEQARKEYTQNIVESDLTLAIRGDANMSCRFYEILSLGRIPLFIDTDCVLPLEDIISYEDFMLRIDYKNIDNICKAVDDFYSKTGDEDFLKMQKNAREVYEKYLTPVNFLQYILPKIKNIK